MIRQRNFNSIVRRRAMTDTAVPFFLVLLVLVGMAYGGWKWWRVYRYEQSRGQAILEEASGPPLTEFELTSSDGSPFRTADMRGKVWVATYFFTTCPGSCIRLNRNIQWLHNRPELQDVTWVSITCDPDTDTLQALAEYAKNWDANPDRWLFCRAELDYTRRVASGMKLFLSRKGHQDYAVVIDKSGQVRGMFDASSRMDCDRLRSMLLKLVDEAPPVENRAPPQNQHQST
jgi:cytochrome oxidase Cu insertion factor (SCO1/SenC/PrrC family)